MITIVHKPIDKHKILKMPQTFQINILLKNEKNWLYEHYIIAIILSRS